MQLDRSEILGLILTVAVVTVALVVALTPPTAMPPSAVSLEAKPDTWPLFDVELLVGLPDSGGYLANGAPLNPTQLGALLQSIAKRYPQMPRGFYVRMGAHRPEADLQLVLSQAASAGWKVFDADKSGLPAPMAPRDIPRGP
jgi:hypothetical protein